MRFGHFDDAKREYVIETPRTPLPWINYLGSEDFFALVSNTAGGYAFYRDARLRRLTRYRYNNCPLDSDGFHVYVKDGDTVTMDSITFRVLTTPGHTPGSVCLIADDVIFSGDTLFQGSCGRTDFPGGSWSNMCASLRRLYELKGNYTVLSGHTGSTTLERERKTNMFMQSALG